MVVMTKKRSRKKETPFILVHSPPRLFRRWHRLNPFILFWRKARWTEGEVKRYSDVIDSPGGHTLDDFDPDYLILQGESGDMITQLRERIYEYEELIKRPGFPTARDLRNKELTEYREKRNAQWWARLLLTDAARQRNIRLAMPVRKTYAAKKKVEAIWIDADPEMIRIRRVAEKLRKFDNRAQFNAYRLEQKPDKPFRMYR